MTQGIYRLNLPFTIGVDFVDDTLAPCRDGDLLTNGVGVVANHICCCPAEPISVFLGC